MAQTRCAHCPRHSATRLRGDQGGSSASLPRSPRVPLALRSLPSTCLRSSRPTRHGGVRPKADARDAYLASAAHRLEPAETGRSGTAVSGGRRAPTPRVRGRPDEHARPALAREQGRARLPGIVRARWRAMAAADGRRPPDDYLATDVQCGLGQSRPRDARTASERRDALVESCHSSGQAACARRFGDGTLSVPTDAADRRAGSLADFNPRHLHRCEQTHRGRRSHAGSTHRGAQRHLPHDRHAAQRGRPSRCGADWRS